MKTAIRLKSGMLGILLACSTAMTASAFAARTQNTSQLSAIEAAKMDAENQIKNLVEPVLNKYCQEECKFMSVNATVDLATPEELSPGFDDVDPKSLNDIEPISAEVKILMDEKVGPVTRSKITDLMQQFLDTLDYPVKIRTQVTRFPAPMGSSGKVAELREKLTRQFRSTLENLFTQFCPHQCMLVDYELKTDVVNSEEAQYGSMGEFIEENGVAIKVRDVSATILVDESLSADDRSNILEMAKLKTNYLKNVTLTAKALNFPKPLTQFDAQGNVIPGSGSRNPAGLPGSEIKTDSKLDSKSETRSDSTTQNNNTLNSERKETQSTQNTTQSTNQNSTAENRTENRAEKNSKEETNSKTENYSRVEKIERVENGDAVQAELQKFKVYGLVFFCAIFSILIFIALAGFRQKQTVQASGATSGSVQGSAGQSGPVLADRPAVNQERTELIAKRYECERLTEELMAIYAQQPKVAKQVFGRILTEEGVETTSAYLSIFGESVVMDLLRDPSLQADIQELMEYHAKNPMELSDDEKLDLLKRLQNRTASGKLVVMGSRSSHQFDFLSDMDGLQILELIRNESLTVKSIVLTQCDSQKRSTIYAQLDPELRLSLMTELSRIDYLPREFVTNVASALKRKRRDNPRLNTEALPGSEVLINLLERTESNAMHTIIQTLEVSSPDSARTVKSKLVSLDTLAHLRDGQLLEVILSLKHEELLNFLKGASAEIRGAIFMKSPKDLVSDLEDELASHAAPSRETFASLERKLINRMKLMANDGLINLVEINERMFGNGSTQFINAGPDLNDGAENVSGGRNLRKVVG